MSKSNAEKKYWQALERIKSRNTEIVNVNESGFRISNLSVALEAGKANPKGYIRPQRYPDLCKAIKTAEAERQASSLPSINKYQKTDLEKKQILNARYKKLREEHENLLEKYLNVVKENFEIKVKLAKFKKSP